MKNLKSSLKNCMCYKDAFYGNELPKGKTEEELDLENICDREPAFASITLYSVHCKKHSAIFDTPERFDAGCRNEYTILIPVKELKKLLKSKNIKILRDERS